MTVQSFLSLIGAVVCVTCLLLLLLTTLNYLRARRDPTLKVAVNGPVTVRLAVLLALGLLLYLLNRGG